MAQTETQLSELKINYFKTQELFDVAKDSGIALQNKAAELVDIYFVVVE